VFVGWQEYSLDVLTGFYLWYNWYQAWNWLQEVYELWYAWELLTYGGANKNAWDDKMWFFQLIERIQIDEREDQPLYINGYIFGFSDNWNMQTLPFFLYEWNKEYKQRQAETEGLLNELCWNNEHCKKRH